MSASEQLNIQLPSPLQSVGSDTLPWSPTGDIEVLIKRDDLIHPIISGNKWRKLQQVFDQWQKNSQSKILSFGGGYSNHLHALGYACYQTKIPFCAMIRGDYQHRLTPMLQDLKNWGTDIRWLTKIQYARKNDENWLKSNVTDYSDFQVIPEGGSGVMVHSGMMQLISELPQDLDYLLCPVGSGGTLAGIIQALYQLQRKTKVIGIAVLKGQDYLESLVSSLITQKHALTQHHWQIIHQYHFGGYAKHNAELLDFCAAFTSQASIAIEPVYSGKLFFGLQQLMKQNYFEPGSKVCAIHTGGLQGARSLISNQKTDKNV